VPLVLQVRQEELEPQEVLVVLVLLVAKVVPALLVPREK